MSHVLIKMSVFPVSAKIYIVIKCKENYWKTHVCITERNYTITSIYHSIFYHGLVIFKKKNWTDKWAGTYYSCSDNFLSYLFSNSEQVSGTFFKKNSEIQNILHCTKCLQIAMIKKNDEI